MQIDRSAFPFPSCDALVAILEEETAKVALPDGDGVILTFRDPDYSAEHGGFHPVEISVDRHGRIQYITDFAYAGVGPFAELVKEIDFDVSLGGFQHLGREFPMERGRDLFSLWKDNFVSYYRMGVYTVHCEPL